VGKHSRLLSNDSGGRKFKPKYEPGCWRADFPEFGSVYATSRQLLLLSYFYTAAFCDIFKREMERRGDKITTNSALKDKRQAETIFRPLFPLT
jgi:hypothetical protein